MTCAVASLREASCRLLSWGAPPWDSFSACSLRRLQSGCNHDFRPAHEPARELPRQCAHGVVLRLIEEGVRPPRPLPNPRACQGGYGVASVYQGAAPGPTVMFRAELDGLPIEEVADIPPPLRRTELNALLVPAPHRLPLAHAATRVPATAHGRRLRPAVPAGRRRVGDPGHLAHRGARAGRQSSIADRGAIGDRQSVRKPKPAARAGFDAGKQINGRCRHLLTDLLGLPLRLAVVLGQGLVAVSRISNSGAKSPSAVALRQSAARKLTIPQARLFPKVGRKCGMLSSLQINLLLSLPKTT